MIILDTNVLSELIRPLPDQHVVTWVSEQPAVTLFTTTITQAEILYGVRLLPSGKRREHLQEAVEAMFAMDLENRILAFDSIAATEYAEIAASRRRAGRPISQFDAQIAAIARRHDATLATRNHADFEGCGIAVVNPWSAEPA